MKLEINLQALNNRQPTRFPGRTFLLNEQAAQAMSEQKSAQLQVNAQDHRIRELSAELTHVVSNAGILTSSAEKSNADLQAARSELAEYRTQIDAMNQHALNMQKLAESQRRTSRRRLRSFGRSRRSSFGT